MDQGAAQAKGQRLWRPACPYTQEIPEAPFEMGDKEQTFPHHWIQGAKNPVFGLNFDPILVDTDGQDSCERRMVGKSPFGTGEDKIMWCTDDPICFFLQNLREDKEAIREAALSCSSPMAPKLQDGHGWGFVNPHDHPRVGPTLHRNYYRLNESMQSNIELLRREAEEFLIDAGIRKDNMMQLMPEQYQSSLATNANVDAPTAQHNYMKPCTVHRSTWA